MSKIDISTLPKFQQVQHEFAQNLRNPTLNKAPNNIEARRMKVYQELFYNNIENFCRNAFPILCSLISNEKWHNIVRDFFTYYRAESPYFIDISKEFLNYLSEHRSPESNDLPFMLELVDWEYMEILATSDRADILQIPHERNGDLFQEKVVISPLAWPVVYEFPVHKIGTDFQPTNKPETPTFLIISRNRQHQVDFFETNALTYHLLMLFKNYFAKGVQITGEQALNELTELTQYPKPEQLLLGGQQILQDLMQRDVILGVNS